AAERKRADVERGRGEDDVLDEMAGLEEREAVATLPVLETGAAEDGEYRQDGSRALEQPRERARLLEQRPRITGVELLEGVSDRVVSPHTGTTGDVELEGIERASRGNGASVPVSKAVARVEQGRERSQSNRPSVEVVRAPAPLQRRPEGATRPLGGRQPAPRQLRIAPRSRRRRG